MSSVAGEPVPLWIDNEAVKSDIIFPVVNHGTGSTTHAYGVTPDIVQQAIESSHRAFQLWKKTTPWHRRDLFQRAAQLLKERRSEVAQLLQVRLRATCSKAISYPINILLTGRDGSR
jgi:acyl-CoA reductase-like NAD-dependent aldehyde dehydrogenase